MERVDERTTANLLVEFLDADGDPAAPTSATYRIDTLEGTAVRAATALAAASVVTITLTPDDNEIYDDLNAPFEVHVVTVRGFYGEDDEVNKEYHYRVKNLTHIASS